MTSILSDSAPAPPALPVSVVVCCDASSRWEQLVAACGSLRNQSHAAREIVLVVDHCQPLYLLAKEQLCGVEVIENHGLRGLAGARNTGVAASTGEVVAFLDDDAVADPDWIRELAAQYTDPRVLGVGGHVEPSWEDRRPSWFPEEFDWVVGCSHPGLPAQLGPVRTLLGANMSFRRTALADVGGFRHDVGLSVGRNPGGRDSKMSARAAAPVDSPVLQYQPAARVSHHVPAERGTWRYFCERCFAEGFSSAKKGPHAGSSSASTAARQNTPTAVAGGLLGAVVRARPPRAAAMLAGAGATTAGYLAGRAQQVVASQSGRTTAASFTVQLSPLALALVLWLLSLTSSVNLRAMSDLGLVSVLPTTYWAALALITISLPVLIHTRRAPSGVLIAYLVGLVLVLHATPAMLYESLRYAWGWKHVGMVDYILRHHAVDPQIGDEFAAYHSWSGFFALNAVFVKALGVSSSLSYASWGPPVFELLVLGPLRMLFTTLTTDGRQAWLALVIFYLGNWVAQDYFAPQAFGYFLYLVVLVMCLRWLSLSGRHEAALPWWRRWLAPDHPGSVVVPAPQRKAVICAVVLLMVAIVTSHQLTPFMLLAALIALVIARHLVVAWLPWLLAALIAGWIYLMAMPFLHKNLYWIVESIGRPGDNTRTGFVDLSQATLQQELVSFAARGLTAGIGLLAVAGWLRLGHIGAPRRTAALLAASPVLLLAANSYGGEMLFRVYLFALPFLAVLAAGTVYPRRRSRGARVALPVVLTVALAVPFCLAYYGKERMNYFTPEEVAASTWLYKNARTGSFLLAATASFPWAFSHYEDYDYDFLEGLPGQERQTMARAPMPIVESTLSRRRGPGYVLLNRSQADSIRYTGVLPNRAMASIESALRADPTYRVVYQNRDATIFLKVDKPAGAR